MKTQFIFTSLVIITSLFFSSCAQSDQPAPQESRIELTAAQSKSSDKEGKHIFYAEWDSWGRSSKGCDGWGLCNFSSCWFCCFDSQGSRIDCKTGQKMSYSGEIVLEGQSGYIIINLDPSSSEEQEAIEQQKALYVDESIATNDLLIHAGEYVFDSDVVGYKVNITVME